MKKILATISLLLIAVLAFAGSVTLAWDASPDVSAVGYRIYYGPTSGNYTNSVVVGGTLIATLIGLKPGTTYYFAATAYNASGVESPFSNETSFKVPPIPVINLQAK